LAAQAQFFRPTDGIQEMEIERQTNGVTNELVLQFANQRHPGSWSDSELLARILDGVADGIAAHDASGQLLFINDAGARMCGYESSSAALLAPPGDFLMRVQAFDANGSALTEPDLPGPRASRGHVIPERLLRLQLRASGFERWLSVKATPILDRRGAVRMSISIFRDVSRERMIEAEHEHVVHKLEVENARLASLVDELRASVRRDDTQRPADR
jgi:PAS domain-containing protein